MKKKIKFRKPKSIVTVGKQADMETMRVYPSKDGINRVNVPPNKQGLSKEKIDERGYSEVVVTIKIPQGMQRPFHPQADLSITLDGWDIRGISGMEVKGYPPFVEFTITEAEKFNESVKHGGFFWQQGIIFTQTLYRKIYPSVPCADCTEGRRTVELGGLCNNSSCDSASPYIRAMFLEQDATIKKEADERGITVSQLIEEKLAQEMKEKAEEKDKDVQSQIERNPDGTPANVSHDNDSRESDDKVAESNI